MQEKNRNEKKSDSPLVQMHQTGRGRMRCSCSSERIYCCLKEQTHRPQHEYLRIMASKKACFVFIISYSSSSSSSSRSHSCLLSSSLFSFSIYFLLQYIHSIASDFYMHLNLSHQMDLFASISICKDKKQKK